MTDSNRLRLTTVRETTLGTTPGSPRFRTARITGESLGFEPVFVQSAELRSDRMNADPIKVNETNQGGINFELSFPVDDSPFSDLIRSAMFSTWVNSPVRDNDGTADSVITAVTAASDTYTVTTGAAFVEGQLVRATGFTNAGNNLIFRAQSGSGATSVVAPASPGLTDETAPPATARLKVVGFQGASGDITATSTGLGSTALDFTTLGLAVGMWVKIGGTAAGDKFATAACNDWARVTAIAATALTLDNLPSGWTTDSGSSKTIKVWFGDYIKNGTTRTSLSIERGFMGQATPTYVLQRGMVAGQWDTSYQTEQIVTGSFNMQGLTGAQDTTSQDASPDAATTNAIMSANVNVGRIAESGVAVASPNFIRSASISMNNNLRMITGVGSVGAVDIGVGECAVTINLETYFGSNALYTKLLAGTVGNINIRTQKDSQAVIDAVPRVTFTGGAPSAGAKNQDVMLPLAGMASYDSLTGAHRIVNRLEYYE